METENSTVVAPWKHLLWGFAAFSEPLMSQNMLLAWQSQPLKRCSTEPPDGMSPHLLGALDRGSGDGNLQPRSWRRNCQALSVSRFQSNRISRCFICRWRSRPNTAFYLLGLIFYRFDLYKWQTRNISLAVCHEGCSNSCCRKSKCASWLSSPSRLA